MNEIFVMTGTVTYAMKAKALLNSLGYKSEVFKSDMLDKRYGCGYGVKVATGDAGSVTSLLSKNGIKVLGIRVNGR